MNKVVNERGHFLNDKQKELKEKIINDCIDSLYDNLRDKYFMFTPQSVCDLIFSVLIIFNREVFVNLFTNVIKDSGQNRKDILNMFSKELIEQINLAMNKDKN